LNLSDAQWLAPSLALRRINVGIAILSTYQEHCCSKHVRGLVPLQGPSIKKDATRVQLGTELVIPSACLLPAYEERLSRRARYRLLATVFHHGPTSVAGHYVVRHQFFCWGVHAACTCCSREEALAVPRRYVPGRIDM